MCWSLEVSIGTFVVGYLVALYLLARQRGVDVAIATLILFYSTMQLWEAVMWATIDPDTKQVVQHQANQLATKAAYYSLYSHVLAVALGLSLWTGRLEIVPVAIGIGFLVIAYRRRPVEFKDTQVEGCHLKWGFDPGFYTSVFLAAMALMFWYIPLSTAIVYALFYIVTFAFAYHVYGPGTVGSSWCWIAAALSGYAVLA